jgi:hypothetical protein
MGAILSGADNSKLIGQHYFRDTGFQWSRDAKSLYLMGDTYLSGGQAFSKNGELWRYDLDTGKLQLVLKPFPVEQYFFGLNNGIYFWISMGPKGPTQLQYFDGKTISNIGDPGAAQISVDQLSTRFTEQPFYSFDDLAYMMHILPAKGVHSRSRAMSGMRCSRSAPALTFASPWETTLKCSFAWMRLKASPQGWGGWVTGEDGCGAG